MLTIILPILLYLPTTYLFLLAYNYTSPKAFLIPSSYQGTVRIVYEQECGIKYKYENRRITLSFPNDGILILNEKFDGGVNNKYYLIDNKGSKIEVPEYFGGDKAIKKPPFIILGGSGTLGPGGPDEIKFSDFYVCNRDTAFSEGYKSSQRFDSLTWKVVGDCKIKK